MSSYLQAVRSFDTTKLPHVSREEAKLIHLFNQLLPPHRVARDLYQAIERMLCKEVGVDFSFQLEKIQTVEGASFLGSLPREGVFVTLTLEPQGEKAFAEVDLLLAHALIDRLLGGEGEPLALLRPLTELEEGVFSYLILKILSQIFEETGETAPIYFRLHHLGNSAKDWHSTGTGSLVALTLRAELKPRSGTIHLAFPSSFVQGGRLWEGRSEEKKVLQKRLRELGFIRTPLWIEGGKSFVKKLELENLKEGDVLLLDRTSLSLQGGRPVGDVTLRVGRGDWALLATWLEEKEGRIRVRLEAGFEECSV